MRIENFRQGAIVLLITGILSGCAPSEKIHWVVAADGSGDYRSVQECFDALPSKPTTWRTVEIKAGEYREKVTLDVYKDKVHIVGHDGATIVWDDHTGRVENDGHVMTTYDTWTFSVQADDVVVENLTICNDAGEVGQAVAVETRGDRIEFIDCRMLGDQDTFFTKGYASRLYLRGCYIEGTTDFIFGPSIALFDSCRIHCKKDSYITAASTTERNRYGYVFRNCTITAADGVKKLYLGRPWKQTAKTVFIGCELPSAIRPEGWHNWNDRRREEHSFYAEWGCTGEGADRKGRVKWSYELSDEQVADYTPEKIFAFKTGSEAFRWDWMPTSISKE